MFCNACGQEVPDGSAFCNHCAAPVARVASAVSSGNYKPAATKPLGGCFFVIGALVLLIMVMSIILFSIAHMTKQESATKSPTQHLSQAEIEAQNAAMARQDAAMEQDRLSKLSPLVLATQGTSIVRFDWHKEGFDNVMVATFVVRNDSQYDVKDVEIRCVHSARSGTVVDSNNRTIYEIVKAHSTRRFTNFNMGFVHSQAARSGCDIQSVKLASER